MTRGVVSLYKIHDTQSTAFLDSEYILFSYERNIMNNFGLRKLPLSPFPPSPRDTLSPGVFERSISTTRRPVRTLTTGEGLLLHVPPRTPRSSGYIF